MNAVDNARVRIGMVRAQLVAERDHLLWAMTRQAFYGMPPDDRDLIRLSRVNAKLDGLAAVERALDDAEETESW